MTWFQEVLAVLNKWRHLGYEDDGVGNRFIGHTPFRGAAAYLNKTFAPLTDANISLLEDEIDIEFPVGLREFLKFTNGMKLFSGSITVDGMRKERGRSLRVAAYQPHDLRNPNLFEPHAFLRDGDISFAFYPFDGSQVAVRANGQVFRFAPDRGNKIIEEWENIENWCRSQVSILAVSFDSQGHRIAPEEKVLAR